MYKRIVSILGKKNQSICGILNVAQQRPNRRDGIRYLSFPQFPRLEYHRLFDLLIYWVPVKICQEGDVFRYHLANSAAFISILGLFRLRNLLFYQRPESLATGEAIAHLRYLKEEGSISTIEENGNMLYVRFKE